MSAAQPMFNAATRRIFALAALVFVLDQFTKWLTLRYIIEGDEHVIIPGFFNLAHRVNTGAAWSMFTGRSVLLAVLAAGTLVAIFLWRHALGLRDRSTQVCFGLLCGGIVGNLTDRLAHGHVIDFIDLHFGSYIYPTFNVADSGICVGVVLYLILSLRNDDQRPKTRD